MKPYKKSFQNLSKNIQVSYELKLERYFQGLGSNIFGLCRNKMVCCIMIYVLLCMGGSKGKVGIQISCIPESRDTSSCILGEIYP